MLLRLVCWFFLNKKNYAVGEKAEISFLQEGGRAFLISIMEQK
jgi:hypothetical protein